MNQDAFDRLPADLQALIDATTGKDAARAVGARWDSIEVPGREYMRTNGVEIIELNSAERVVFADAAEHLVEQRIAVTEAKGLPAREFLARVRELAARY
jgi:TRAP-type C4-dicarboxylate transport system substrate-binding protein